MLERLSEKFAGKLISAGIISETNADVYVYGFFQLAMMILNIVTTIILGVLFKLLIPCILLNLSYIPLRMNAGGHHADSPMKCYINSAIMIAALLAVIKWIPIHPAISAVLLALSGIVIWILAPVEAENNPWNDTEKLIYRRRSIVILLIETIAFVISLFFMKNWISETIMLGIVTESLILIIGRFFNCSKRQKN
ncbi:MAG: accessory gene regulator B family protein [Ruminococcus sp.]|nr:accessory gene regulator B family protein [Ruminococcus sp.]